MDRLFFRSFGSGSSGNCYLLANSSYGILIDAGVGVRNVRRFLRTMGLDYHRIWGVLITHDHTDHIQAVGNIGEKHHVPVYTTQKIHDGINRNYKVTQKLSSSRRIIEVGREFIVGDFRITAFPVSHDASESVGYSITYQDKTITVATDLGYIDTVTAGYLRDSNGLILEANYDPKMLLEGVYPEFLKQRIMADNGHLSNVQAASYLAENFNEKWQYVFLCHLSKDNNTPDKVVSTIEEAFRDRDVSAGKLRVLPLPRTEPSQMHLF